MLTDAYYKRSRSIALRSGYAEQLNSLGYKGKIYVKDGKIWIHDIWYLKNRLGIYQTNELKEIGYDVDAYWDNYNKLNPSPIFNSVEES